MYRAVNGFWVSHSVWVLKASAIRSVARGTKKQKKTNDIQRQVKEAYWRHNDRNHVINLAGKNDGERMI